PRIPQTLDWDLWPGPAPLRPYNPIYVPFKWRGFYEYGTGAIGDMGVHNFDAAYWGLELGEPIIAEVKESSEGTEDSPPLWSITELTFPKSGTKPPIKVTFYDGKKLPPTDLFQGETPTDNGALIIGKNGTIYQRTWHGGMGESDMFKFIGGDAPAEAQPTSKTQLPRSEAGHHQEWILACKGQGKAMSDFNYASRLTESLLVGQLAIRTGKRIEWNAAKMRATNAPEADIFINPPYRKGWTL
ncbi:MAG TPA: gfo/Idh/MocA family oxidoreductase, partial [Methylomirabilota bacterium]|nr:gfo/Idh/MocA family oxidoreductase [Methylomirabilota bacterium]